MAISPAARTMNQSAHTLADLQALAKNEPQKATEYLQGVEAQLRKFGKSAEADAVKALLGKTGDLVERMAAMGDQLTTVFPAEAADWAKVQVDRAATIGYGVDPAKSPPAQFLSGTMTRENDVVKFTTDGGRELTLSASALASKHFQMGNEMMEGFLGDGKLVLHGTIGEDNQTFNVEAYALNTDGKFNEFTFGRVSVNGDKLTIDGARGPVEVTDPETKKVLASMPRLAVIVPGGPVERDGKLVHEGKIDVFMALARFKVAPPATADGPVTSMSANMADNHFVMKPLEFPSEQLGRANHQKRLWVRGFPELGADGEPTKFKANYISQQLDSYSFRTGATTLPADPVQAAVNQDIV